jgi:membrane-associated phospholipid phosphatase
MSLSSFLRDVRSATPAPRVSALSRPAVIVTFALLAMGIVASIATKFTLASLPNIVLLVVGVVILDVLSQHAPQVRIVEAIQTILYGVLYLIVTCVCGVLAAYAMQRLAFPLRDGLLGRADAALGLDWLAYVHWVDRHAVVQSVLHFAYDTISLQIALPVLVLAVSNRLNELRVYLAAFAIAFSVTIVISALMPAAGPIAFADRAAFHILHFTGATPVDHLTRLRAAGPLIMDDFPGGIATFPSFHSTVAVLTPLALRSHRRILAALIVLNAAMLAGTVSEGAHYFIDVLAGSGMAVFGYVLALRLIAVEDRLRRRPEPSLSPAYSTGA